MRGRRAKTKSSPAWFRQVESSAEPGQAAWSCRRRPALNPRPPSRTKPDPFDRELRGFQRDVTLGDWSAVKAFLRKLEKEESKAAYNHLLQSLASGQAGGQGMMPGQVQMMNRGRQVQMQTQMQMQMQPQQFMMERNVFANQDVISLAWAAPHGLEEERLDNLGQILRQSLDLGQRGREFHRSGSRRAAEARRGRPRSRSGRRPRSCSPPTAPSSRDSSFPGPRRLKGQRSRGAQPAGAALPGPASTRQEGRPPRASLEGDPGGAGRRQGRPRTEGRSDSPGRRAHAQDQGRAGPGVAGGRASPGGPSAAWRSSRPSARPRPRGCKPTRSTRLPDPSRSSFRSWPSRPCSARRPSAARSGRRAWHCWRKAGSRRPSFPTSTTSRPAWARACSSTRSAICTTRIMTRCHRR